MTSRLGTLHESQDGVLRTLRELYLPGGPEVDVTYSRGALYDSGALPRARLRFDKHPTSEDVVMADSSCLPMPDGSVSSMLYDPPYVIAPGEGSRMGRRFSGYPTVAAAHADYRGTVREAARVLAPRGILVVKIQDVISGGRQHRGSIVIWREAIECGLQDEDWLVARNVSRLVGHNWQRQQHARKTHVSWLVFRKPRRAGFRR